jgi:hypothetical protein
MDYSRTAPKWAKKKKEICCAYCGIWFWESKSKTKLNKRHFCSVNCYALFRKERLPKEEHNNWKGGITPYEAHRRWVKKHPEHMAHLKARRYARERNAKGSHTFKEWKELCEKWGNTCCQCRKKRKLTKDHIVPLSKGGTDYISNIQPMCRSCNSRKWKFIYENPELLK